MSYPNRNPPQPPRPLYPYSSAPGPNYPVPPAPKVPQDKKNRKWWALFGSIVTVVAGLIAILQFTSGSQTLFCLLHSCATPTTGGTATVDPTAVTHTAQVIVKTNQISFVGGQAQTVSVSCDSNEQLVGGGFASDPYVGVFSSYPSNPSTWTLKAYNYGSGTPVPLTAYADCVQANFSLGMIMKQSELNPPSFINTHHETSIACPAGSTLTGGGEDTFSPLNSTYASVIYASYPTNNSWVAGASNLYGNVITYLHVYALCATQNIQSVALAQKSAVVQQTDQIQVGCQSDTLLASGGFYSDANDQRFKPAASYPGDQGATNWTLLARYASGNGSPAPNATVYGVCMKY